MWQLAHDTLLSSDSIGSLNSFSPSETLAGSRPVAALTGRKGDPSYESAADGVDEFVILVGSRSVGPFGKNTNAKTAAIATTIMSAMVNFKQLSFLCGIK
jgi:hypothetical protein